MESIRILAIAKFIDSDDKLIDVGCDHGYLGIYLKRNNKVKDLLLTDVSNNALNSAITNIKRSNLEIATFCTDGLQNIDLDNYNTVSISGMGTNTILNILTLLKNNNSINKLILQSNNDLDILRKEVNNLGFTLDDEITVKENDIYYVICKFTKGNSKLSEEEILFGLNKEDKKEYYNYLIDTYKNIIRNIKDTSNEKYILLNNYINILNRLLEESR